MTNNDIFYKLRKIFHWDEEQMGNLFKSVDYIISPLDLFAWMKQEQFEGFKAMPDQALAALLNALIINKRGMKDGIIPEHEMELNNNLILRKLKIALSLKDQDIVDIFKLADMRVSKSEINAFFRDPKSPDFRWCKDQFLRNFLQGLVRQSKDDIQPKVD